MESLPIILLEAQAYSASVLSKDGSAPMSVAPVFKLCAFMYGTIGALWILHLLGYIQKVRTQGELGTMYILLICATWCSFSVGMHVLNKSLAVTLHAPALIVAFQMLVAVVILGMTSGRQFLEANRKQMTTWLVVPIFFAGMLCSGMYTFHYMSLSLMVVMRNVAPLVVLPLERMIIPADKAPQFSVPLVGALLIIVAGALVYSGGLNDISIIGICFSVANMFLGVSDRLIQRRLLIQECQTLTSSVCAIINNAVGMLLCLLLGLCTQEFQKMSTPENQVHWSDPHLMILLSMSSIAGIGICYMGFECQRELSATSFLVMCNISKVAVIGCGIVFFHDPIRSPMVVVGLLLSVTGSFIYSWMQLPASKAEAKALNEDLKDKKMSHYDGREKTSGQKDDV